MSFIQRFVQDQRGVTAIEYAVLAVVVVVAVSALASTVNGMFSTAFTSVKNKVTNLVK